eukprot:58305_1
MSIETEWNLKWNKLVSFPFTSFSQPFVTDDNEFIIAATKRYYSNGDGIYKLHKNEWIKIFDYDENSEWNMYSTAYDNINKLLYVSDTLASRMLLFDLKTKSKVTSISQQYKRYVQFIFVENKLHQICNSVRPGSTVDNGDHYIYDQTKQFKKITTFKSFEHLSDYSSIYLKSKKSILSFGGYNIEKGGYQNSIYRFSCIDSKWKELNIKMPIKLSDFALVSTTNEQYIILLGGYIRLGDTVDIFIYNTK